MAKKLKAVVKLQIPAGKANPAPPVGTALGPHGVNIMGFCKAFNAETQTMEQGMPVPVIITVFSDKSFSFIKKTPLKYFSKSIFFSSLNFLKYLISDKKDIFVCL